jgi:hypothetical protein
MREELLLAHDLASSFGWELNPDYEALTVVAKMLAHTGDPFVLEIRCDNYKEIPPLIEFIDPDSGERGSRRAYPQAVGSFFHTSGPCICAPFNRKAYQAFVPGAPHGDWSPADWMTSTANGVTWSNFSKLGDMLGLVYRHLSRPELYQGRMT